MGITQATLADWRSKDVTTEDVRDLTNAEAAGIYKARYWDKMSLDLILSQELAEAVMDFGVNAGIKTAGKSLQQTLNWVRGAEVLAKDGAIGPATLREVNLTPERDLVLKCFEVRTRYYVNIARHRPQNRKFLYAWMRRALDHV